MAITAKAEVTQRDLPNRGLQQGVVVDVVGPTLEETPWGAKEKVRIVSELAQEHPEFGGPFRVSKKYTLSLHEKSTLSADLESGFGKSIPPEKRIEGIDLETLIGRRFGFIIVYSTDDQGREWANIQTMIPPDASNTMVPSPGYVREKDKPAQSGDGANRQVAPAARPTPADVYQPQATAQPPYQPAATAQPAYQPPPSAPTNAGATYTGNDDPAGYNFPPDDLPFKRG